MEKICLRDYFDMKGFGKYTSKINVGEFAKMVGVNISVISRILKGKYEVKHNSECIDKINAYLNQDGYELELIAPYSLDYEEEIAKLKQLIADRDEEIRLQDELIELMRGGE